MIRLVDSHCHLDFDAFDDDREAVLQRARAAGVEHVVIPGVDIASWHKIAGLCAGNAALSPCYGLHPYRVGAHAADHLDELRHFAGTHACSAIGECGLDFRDGQADRERQQFYFEAQLDIASSIGKPVVIHAVKATEQVITTLAHFPGLRGVVHSYSGSYEQAQRLVGMGFCLGFGGAVTFERAKRPRDNLARLPLSALLLETDAPDQPGAAHAGQRNEPAYVVEVLAEMAALRGEPAPEIAARTTANARQLFGIA